MKKNKNSVYEPEMDVELQKELKELFQKHTKKMRQQHLEDDFSSHVGRARAISIGTAFGGTTDLMMRRSDGTVTWAHLQPVEVVELIHQLSANIGCHVAIKPREDFSSWRAWRKPTQEQLEHLNGFPPFADMLEGSNSVGKKSIAIEQNTTKQISISKEEPKKEPIKLENKQKEVRKNAKKMNTDNDQNND